LLFWKTSNKRMEVLACQKFYDLIWAVFLSYELNFFKR
jgi:hypothetical protein